MTVAPIPAAWYAAGEPFQHERRTRFARAWLLLGRIGALPAAGDYQAQTLAGWPVVAIRGDDGTIRAFRNTCRHQQMTVVERVSGHADQGLRCRYHGWTYDLRGRFQDAPAQYAPPAESSPAATTLIETDLAEWQDLLFVRIAPEGAAFPGVDLPADWPFMQSNPLRYHSEATQDFGCNWKVLVEHIVATMEARSGTDFTLRWQWPNLVIQPGPGERIIHQIIPRAFARTRVISHFYFSSTAAVDARVTAVGAELEADRDQCERTQQSIAAGEPLRVAQPGSGVERFRAAVITAHATSEVLDPLAKVAT